LIVAITTIHGIYYRDLCEGSRHITSTMDEWNYIHVTVIFYCLFSSPVWQPIWQSRYQETWTRMEFTAWITPHPMEYRHPTPRSPPETLGTWSSSVRFCPARSTISGCTTRTTRGTTGSPGPPP
jgi:hypothetical protein